MLRAFRALLVLSLLAWPIRPQRLPLPNNDQDLRFAVIGDSGTGKSRQYEVAAQMVRSHQRFPFSFVLMNGDNIYGGQSPKDFVKKFERPYGPLLDAGVKFYASIGNHDDAKQIQYPPFHMDGRRYYSFSPDRHVLFLALDSSSADKEQMDWLEKQLSDSHAEWKIAFFHHPLYSSGKKHGPNIKLRNVLEPLFVRYGVSVVFSGHEHFYERIQPQKGIAYFIMGSAGQLRKHNIRKTGITAKGFDTDNAFMLCEIEGNGFYFQTVSRTGETVDSGVIRHPGASTR